MIKQTSKILVRVILYGTVALGIACGVFLFRGQQRLLDLISHSYQKGTEVYSIWLSLDPHASISQDYVTAHLALLGYEKVKGPLAKAGQYRSEGSEVDIWTRGFAYPDQTLASQEIHLTFWNGRLGRVETRPDKREVPGWRLEPKRLANWTSAGGASQPKIRLSDLPSYVPQAVIAIEDRRFYEHGAIDVRGLLRAIWVDVRKGELRQGGSTISQQLSRSIFLNINRTLTRKLLEAGLAFYLEARYSKTQLLEMYLNQVYWGQDQSESVLGLESASRSFFGKPARELSIAESAMLAGLLQSPNHYSPRANPDVARQRRSLVLSLMANQGFITRDQMAAGLKEPLKLAPTKTRVGEAPYFVSTLQDTLAQRYSLSALMAQGWQIYTTLDPVLQAHAAAALRPSVGQAALVAIEPPTGAIRAWVGGTDYGKSSFDRVVYAKRQPGSAFKPFVMLAALDTRKANAATLLEDKPFTVKTPQGPWKPLNYDRKSRGRVSLRDALVYSLNIPTVHLAMQVGLDKVAAYAHKLGIQSPLREVPSLALGTSEVSVWELTAAYATLANKGRYAPPYSIEMIMGPGEEVIESHTPETYEAVPETSAFLITRMLQAVLAEGTAKVSRDFGLTFPAAGKTGTSENYQDAWFVGYTPQLAAGVWVGYDQPRTLGHSAAGIALPLWVSFMQKALSYGPEVKWEEPKELVWKTIDLETGQLARSGCPQRLKEAFLPGAVPEKICERHPGGLLGFFYRLRKK